MAADPRSGRGGRAYLRKRTQLKHRAMKAGTPCAWCGQPFDWTLPPQHPMAFTADHVIALANGGDLLGDLQGLHRLEAVTPEKAPTKNQTSEARHKTCTKVDVNSHASTRMHSQTPCMAMHPPCMHTPPQHPGGGPLTCDDAPSRAAPGSSLPASMQGTA